MCASFLNGNIPNIYNLHVVSRHSIPSHCVKIDCKECVHMMIAQQWGAWGGHFHADIVVFADSASCRRLWFQHFASLTKRIGRDVET